MSGIIWGKPLVCAHDTTDFEHSMYAICDLNNWIKTSYISSVKIDYDASTRTNTFAYRMVSGHEKMYYKLSVEPDTYYRFTAKMTGNFTENNVPGRYMWVMVCSDILPEAYIEEMTDPPIIVKERIKANYLKQYELEFYSESYDSVYLYLDFSAVTDFSSPTYVVSAISCNKITSDPIHYAQKPFNLNILGGDVWNFIAVEPGAWFYSIFDSRKTHHTYFLSGNEFKLLEFQDADGNGVIPHKEYHSTSITIEGRQYYSLHLSRTVDSVCPFPTKYYLIDEFPSDEQIYLKLTDYVLNWIPYDRGDVLGLWALRNLLSANSGDVTVDIDDLKAMLKGYTVEEYQNPYLDDPHGENPNFGIDE